MLDVGLDIHSTRISVCVLNQTGQVVHRSQVRGIEDMLRVLRGLPDRFEVCYEASCGYGHDHDLLRPLTARVPGRPPRPVAADLPVEEQE
jgi:transposase